MMALMETTQTVSYAELLQTIGFELWDGFSSQHEATTQAEQYRKTLHPKSQIFVVNASQDAVLWYQVWVKERKSTFFLKV